MRFKKVNNKIENEKKRNKTKKIIKKITYSHFEIRIYYG